MGFNKYSTRKIIFYLNKKDLSRLYSWPVIIWESQKEKIVFKMYVDDAPKKV